MKNEKKSDKNQFDVQTIWPLDQSLQKIIFYNKKILSHMQSWDVNLAFHHLKKFQGRKIRTKIYSIIIIYFQS